MVYMVVFSVYFSPFTYKWYTKLFRNFAIRELLQKCSLISTFVVKLDFFYIYIRGNTIKNYVNKKEKKVIYKARFEWFKIMKKLSNLKNISISPKKIF